MTTKVDETSINGGPFFTIKQFAERHPEFKEGGIRWAVHNAEKNGLASSGAIKRRNLSGDGKRGQVRLDEPKFLAWWAAA
jgi:hypothetical protein